PPGQPLYRGSADRAARPEIPPRRPPGITTASRRGRHLPRSDQPPRHGGCDVRWRNGDRASHPLVLYPNVSRGRPTRRAPERAFHALGIRTLRRPLRKPLARGRERETENRGLTPIF